MSEMRQDPTTKEWVIIATERHRRPSDFIHQLPRPDRSSSFRSCPFCPGNEEKTPPAKLSYSNQEGVPWQVRVFDNGFPAVRPGSDTSRKIESNFFLSMGGAGYHEIIVESPMHLATLALMHDEEVALVLRAYRERYSALARMPSVKTIIIFKNHGPSAGTSLVHPHSQLVAISVVPRHIRIQYEVATSYYDDNGRCLYSDITDNELKLDKRIIMQTDKFVVFHPFASHRPFETWIMPRAHQASFSQVSAEDIRDLAGVLRITLLKLHRALDDPDFNICVDSAPIGDEYTDYYIWHMRIIPRLTEIAGFEIGSGIYINSALPEETAQFIRELPVQTI